MTGRMKFLETIIDSDIFLDMPHSTQLLYFHFVVRADDDGFIVSPRKIMKIINASDDNLKILVYKRLVKIHRNGDLEILHFNDFDLEG